MQNLAVNLRINGRDKKCCSFLNKLNILLQKLGSYWRENADRILCVVVHREDIAEISRNEIIKEDPLRKYCHSGEQGTVLRTGSGLEEDQEVRGAWDTAAEQQAG